MRQAKAVARIHDRWILNDRDTSFAESGFMKLLMVTNYFESHQGGLDLIGGRLVRELLRLGEDVRWVASDVTPPPQDDELRLRAVPVRLCNATERRLGIPFPFPGFRAVRIVAREIRGADAVLLQDSLYPMCIVAFLCAALWRKPVIIAQHVGIVPYRNPVFRLIMALLNRVVARPMLARAERVAFFSEITARYFAGVRHRAAPKSMFTGVDTEIFHPLGAAEKTALRRRMGLSPERPVVLFVGRFVEKKGLPILAHMVRQRPEIQWVFAGWGHLDPEAWGAPNVSVVRGRSGADLAPLYQSSDVFVLPSKGEGFPLVIQEALACGLPVVCSAETAEADRAVTPLLFPVAADDSQPGDAASAFCREIDRRLADSVGADAAGERFNFVLRRYSWPACGAEYRELIRGAVHDRQRRARRASTPRTEAGQV
jgi:glycosyltransferase involved in cell wall biosynthesis